MTDKELLEQAAGALMVFNNNCNKFWAAKGHAELKKLVHDTLTDMGKIISSDLLDFMRQEKLGRDEKQP